MLPCPLPPDRSSGCGRNKVGDFPWTGPIGQVVDELDGTQSFCLVEVTLAADVKNCFFHGRLSPNRAVCLLCPQDDPRFGGVQCPLRAGAPDAIFRRTRFGGCTSGSDRAYDFVGSPGWDGVGMTAWDFCGITGLHEAPVSNAAA